MLLRQRRLGHVLLVLVVLLAMGIPALAQGEAPELAALVAEGKLPPLEERLPVNPLVVEPEERVGEYGGRWRVSIIAPNETFFMSGWSYVGLVGWDRAQSDVVPKLAESVEVSECGTTFVFHLREGLRWSDGEFFTADDIMFWYEDILMNDLVSPVMPDWMVVAGEVGVVEKLSDYAVRFRFADAHGLFLQMLAVPHEPWAPRHYLEQFHAAYADEEELAKLVDESSYNTWYDLLNAKSDSWHNHNPELPQLQPWLPTTEPPAERFTFTRNPYYWAVDTEGNQLPYIDEVVMWLVQDAEVLNLRAIAGEADLQYRNLSFDNFTLYKENEESGDYQVYLWDNPQVATVALLPNLNTEDPVLREIFHQADFRRALSLAIDRDLINHVMYMGLGVPMQVTAPPGGFFREEYAQAYAQYDPETANQKLDALGLDQRDSRGVRLRPDGKPLNITINTSGEKQWEVDILELVQDNFRDIGIGFTISPLERTLFRLRVRSGKAEMGSWNVIFEPTNPLFYAPIHENTYWAPQYAQWYLSGDREVQLSAEGEEVRISGIRPPEDIQRLQDLWDQIKLTPDPVVQSELWDEIFRSQAENVWTIGTVGLVPTTMIVRNHFHNVPERSSLSWGMGRHLGHAQPAQFFIAE